MSDDRVGSRWWYWIAIEPLVIVLVAVAFLVDAVLVAFGLGVVFLIVRLLALVSYYFDTRAIADAEVTWEPNTGLYLGLGFLFGFFFAPIYRYVRHGNLGTP